MRPLESHLEMSTHLWMYNRLKEMLKREGILAEDADDRQIRHAVADWLEMVAQHNHATSSH